MKSRLSIAMLIAGSLIAAPVYAKLNVVGTGADMHIDVRNFPAEIKGYNDLLKAKCSRCHNAERIITAVTSGVAPISGQPFDLAAMKNLVSTMSRKANAGGKNSISKEESGNIASLLMYLMKRAEM